MKFDVKITFSIYEREIEIDLQHLDMILRKD